MNRGKPFPLAELEAFVHGREHGKALASLMGVLNLLEQGHGAQQQHAVRAYTRLASAVTALFADQSFAPDPRAFQELCLYKRMLDSVFRLSAFRGYGHLRALLARQAGDAAAVKAMYCHALTSGAQPGFPELFKRFPGESLAVYLGMLTSKCVLHPKAWDRREKLLAMSALLQDVPLPASLMGLAKSVWMLCSFAGGKNKHEIKAHLNAMIEKLLAASGISPAPLQEPRQMKKKPTLLVCAEIFTSDHAMFRCYAPAVMQLRGSFRLVVMAGEESLDARVRAVFDQCIEAPADTRRIPEIIARVQDLAPDMIYYPSLGMRPWTLALANLRLAPIQVMSLGHPATSRSRHVDYMVAGSEFNAPEGVFSETLVLMGAPGFLQAERPADRPEPMIRERPKVLKVAVNAKSFKLGPQLLGMCRRMASEAGRKLEYNFFPNESGILLQNIRAEIKSRLPAAVVHPKTDYETYLHTLNECDMALGTFPFGGSNSAVDLLVLGIPLVTLTGEEPHSRTEARFLRALGLPANLTPGTAEGFIQGALKLMTDDEARAGLSRDILAADPADILFRQEHEQFPEDFKNTMLWIYRRHELIRESGERVVRPSRLGESNSNKSH